MRWRSAVLCALAFGAGAVATTAPGLTAPEPMDPPTLPPTMAPPRALAVPDSLRGYPIVIGASTRLDGSPAQHAPLTLYARDTLTLIGTLYVPGVGWVRDTLRVTSAPAPPLPVPDRRPRS